VLAVGLLLLVAWAASASADEQSESSGLPTSQDIAKAIAEGEGASPVPETTDPSAAEEAPHRDLGRTEAVELFESVFGAELKAPAGIFDELEVEKFLAPNVAVIASPESSPETEAPASGPPAGEAAEAEPNPPEPGSTAAAEAMKEENGADLGDPAEEGPRVKADEIPAQESGATLLSSTVPFRVEGASGAPEPVDLSLERSEGELQPAAPLVEVGVPQELGEGIALPAQQIQIELAGAPGERAPSTVGGSVAVYPNVAQDTDFAIAPTPTGVETLTQLRSADSPRTQTLKLELPEGAQLKAADNGGASVTLGGEPLLGVAPPTALDANGAQVPVSLTVSGNDLVLEVQSNESTQFPVLLDPLFESYEWKSYNAQTGINQTTGAEDWSPEIITQVHPQDINLHSQTYETWVPLNYGEKGLDVEAYGEHIAGDHSYWLYTVPRYFKDYENPKIHERPTSYIAHMNLWDVVWRALSPYNSPYMYMGLWDSFANNWVAGYYSHESLAGHGLTDMSWQYQFANENAQHEPDTHAKVANVGIYATETRPNSEAELYVGAATVELGDREAPKPPTAPPPTSWVNQAPVSIAVAGEDTGLGVSSIRASTEQLDSSGKPLHTWIASYGCTGVGNGACPRNWTTNQLGHQHLTIEPALLPTGVDYLNLVAEDPVGNQSKASYAEVRVDHAAPSVALSGTATETGRLGGQRPSYLLKVNATDGSSSAPQSGVTKVAVEFDGQVVKTEEKACATENCAMPVEWTLESAKYNAGQHTIRVTATDAAGNSSAPAEVQLALNPSPPTLSVSGSMTEQATLGTTRPRYKLKAESRAIAPMEPKASGAVFSSAFGSAGTGSGQFAHPAGIALDAKGNLWVVDEQNYASRSSTRAANSLRLWAASAAAPASSPAPPTSRSTPKATSG
jgi:hypothetical protein